MSIYREYDIRGIFKQELNEDVVFNIGLTLAKEIKEKGGRCVAIGYDARTHGTILFEWLSNGIATQDITIYNLGMVPTPVAYFSLYHKIKANNKEIKVDSSIMITGSHNPKEYNGFKITLFKEPFYGKKIKILEDKIKNNMQKPMHTNKDIHNVNALDVYIDFLTNHFKHLKNFPYPISVDCGNGVAGIAIKNVLDNLNIKYYPLFFNPDGNFPNHHPDPSEEKNLESLKQNMNNNNTKIGIAFDGDADRLTLIINQYTLKGDELAILFARKMKNDGLKPIVIGEVKCSSNMFNEINKIGTAVMFKTGHSNLKVKLKELKAHLAAEMSGHIFFNDKYFGFDDAIYAAFRSLELFLNANCDEVIESIYSLPKIFSTPEEKIQSSEDEKFQIIKKLALKLKNPKKSFPKIIDIITIDGLRIVFEDGWGLIRASNTTPVLVTRFEAISEDKLMLYKQELLNLIKEVKS